MHDHLATARVEVVDRSSRRRQRHPLCKKVRRRPLGTGQRRRRQPEVGADSTTHQPTIAVAALTLYLTDSHTHTERQTDKCLPALATS
jgi:hypothetical protein